jgi:hypothetical protein
MHIILLYLVFLRKQLCFHEQLQTLAHYNNNMASSTSSTSSADLSDSYVVVSPSEKATTSKSMSDFHHTGIREVEQIASTALPTEETKITPDSTSSIKGGAVEIEDETEEDRTESNPESSGTTVLNSLPTDSTTTTSSIPVDEVAINATVSDPDDKDDEGNCKLCGMYVDPARMEKCVCGTIGCRSCLMTIDNETHVDEMIHPNKEDEDYKKRIKCPACVKDPETRCSSCGKYCSKNIVIKHCRVCGERICGNCRDTTSCCNEFCCTTCTSKIEDCENCVAFVTKHHPEDLEKKMNIQACPQCRGDKFHCTGCKKGCRRCNKPCIGCNQEKCKECIHTHGNGCIFCSLGEIPENQNDLLPSDPLKTISENNRKKIRQQRAREDAAWTALEKGNPTEQQIKEHEDTLRHRKEADDLRLSTYLKRELERLKKDQNCGICNGCGKNGCKEHVFPCPCCNKLFCAKCHYLECKACGDQLCCRGCCNHVHLGQCMIPECRRAGHQINQFICKICHDPFSLSVCCDHRKLKLGLKCRTCYETSDDKSQQPEPSIRKAMPTGFRRRIFNQGRDAPIPTTKGKHADKVKLIMEKAKEEAAAERLAEELQNARENVKELSKKLNTIKGSAEKMVAERNKAIETIDKLTIELGSTNDEEASKKVSSEISKNKKYIKKLTFEMDKDVELVEDLAVSLKKAKAELITIAEKAGEDPESDPANDKNTATIDPESSAHLHDTHTSCACHHETPKENSKLNVEPIRKEQAEITPSSSSSVALDQKPMNKLMAQKDLKQQLVQEQIAARKAKRMEETKTQLQSSIASGSSVTDEILSKLPTTLPTKKEEKDTPFAEPVSTSKSRRKQTRIKRPVPKKVSTKNIPESSDSEDSDNSDSHEDDHNDDSAYETDSSESNSDIDSDGEPVESKMQDNKHVTMTPEELKVMKKKAQEQYHFLTLRRKALSSAYLTKRAKVVMTRNEISKDSKNYKKITQRDMLDYTATNKDVEMYLQKQHEQKMQQEMMENLKAKAAHTKRMENEAQSAAAPSSSMEEKKAE